VVSTRLGVLDVGSNTVHLLVVDAHRGARPTPMTSDKTELRLAERIDASGRLTDQGTNALVTAIGRAAAQATAAGCVEVLAFATSALRDATNCDEVVSHVRTETGVALQLLPGADEARYTFLAARRWCGWSAGRLLVLDIGGGSLELAVGGDEHPDHAVSVPLGAGRLTREWFLDDPPRRCEITALEAHLDAVLAPVARTLRRQGEPDLAVATSKTFRSLARLTGAGKPVLTAAELGQLLAFITRMSSRDLADLKGVSPGRAHQLVAGALVARAAMRALHVGHVEICPWALREGVIFRRLDTLDGGAPIRDHDLPVHDVRFVAVV
jgi:exopolyphosphatase / guanosine-5'-triphosphate,3'-diphosphate pyrophosphatase